MAFNRFGFSIAKMTRKDTMPFNPHIVIELRTWLTGETGAPAVTGNLMTELEIDARVDRLKANLDVVARQAKLALRRAQRETQQIVKKRRTK